VVIKANEEIDQIIKNASVSGKFWKNSVTYKEILNSFRDEYSNINAYFIERVSQGRILC